MNVHSAEWREIETHYQNRLRILRERLEGPCDPIETSRIRGAIAELKRVADLAKP